MKGKESFLLRSAIACIAGCVLVLAMSASAAASTLVVGAPATPGAASCFPFGCNYNFFGSGVYQQVYSSTAFSGPMTITGLKFYNTDQDAGATDMNGGTFTISLSTTSADWNSLDTNPANNVGGDSTDVFSGSLTQPWSFGNTLSIVFTMPFLYTPGAGANLLMNVVATGTDDFGGDIFFDANINSTAMGKFYSGFLGDTVANGEGLVTGFVTTANVPEPSALALVLTGLVGLGIVYFRS